MSRLNEYALGSGSLRILVLESISEIKRRMLMKYF